MNKKYISMAMVSILIALLPVGPVRAAAEKQNADEQALMALFYEEDDLVEAATGAPKPISQVAENVTIISQEEIDALHAHNLSDVLKYVAGVHLSTKFEPFNTSLPLIHGSEIEHVLILIDGIRSGYRFEDFPELVAIPIRTVKRIEIIKGPASSTWGSALGGVINIITKNTGNNAKPNGEVFATYGEHNTYEASAEVHGRLSKLGYYLQAGRQHTDGITLDRAGENSNVFSKVDFELPKKSLFTFSLNYSEPEYTISLSPTTSRKNIKDVRTFYYSGTLDVPFTNSLTSSFSIYRYEHKDQDTLYSVLTGLKIRDERIYDTTTEGFTGRFVLNGAKQTAVLGFEFERADMVVSIIDYDFPNFSTGPVNNNDENWAIFGNDTISLGNFTLIPGLRYDNLELSDNVLSPSLGFTYLFADHTVLRGTVSRGFRKPTVGVAQHNAFDVYWGIQVTNPVLESVDVKSAQVGFETTALRWGHLKTSLFVHELDELWIFDNVLLIWVNNGGSTFRGFDAEIKTLSWNNFSLQANASYVRIAPDLEPSDTHWLANIMLRYDEPQLFSSQFLGHYVDYGPYESQTVGGSNDMIWDLHLAKKIPFHANRSIEIFGIGHNLFDGNQTRSKNSPNAGRWFEVGARLLL